MPVLELPVVGVQAEFLNLEDHAEGDEVHDGRDGDDDEVLMQQAEFLDLDVIRMILMVVDWYVKS